MDEFQPMLRPGSHQLAGTDAERATRAATTAMAAVCRLEQLYEAACKLKTQAVEASFLASARALSDHETSGKNPFDDPMLNACVAMVESCSQLTDHFLGALAELLPANRAAQVAEELALRERTQSTTH